MQFQSTRGGGLTTFREALFQGLAPDGGLYHPDSEPDLREVIGSFDGSTPFVEIAETMIHSLFPDEYSKNAACEIARTAFPFEPKLNRLDDRSSTLELFHGPSCAFKDFGASFLATTMEEHLAQRDTRAIILTATSGDTGSAVAQAFYGKRNIDVAILYPSGRVSPLQEQQLTTLGGNVTALEVEGSFDDCQRMVKEAFVDAELSKILNLTSANSINVGRLIPQSFYYIWARAQMKDAKDFVFCVPSGNFGNLTAGVLAWRWGMAVDRFIAATNANDVVPEYLETGIYTPRPSVQTLANAMDVGAPSNFERLRKIFDDSNLDITETLYGWAVTDEEIAETMRMYYEEKTVLVCPHTAAGLRSAAEVANHSFSGDETIVTLATAHPAKFVEVAEEAIGIRPEIPERLASLLNKKKESIVVKPDLEALRSVLKSRYL